jgi:hypothetical protein
MQPILTIRRYARRHWLDALAFSGHDKTGYI